MAVDQPGEYCFPPPIDGFRLLEAGRHLFIGTNRHNLVIVDGYRSVINDGTTRVSGDNGDVFDNCIHACRWPLTRPEVESDGY